MKRLEALTLALVFIGCGGYEAPPEELEASAAAVSSYWEYLGPGRSVSDRVTPKWGIRYNDRGFSGDHTAYLEAALSFMASEGVHPSLIAEANCVARKMTGDPEQIGRWIDEAFERMRERYVVCGGSWAASANGVSPSSFRVEVMSAPFSTSAGEAAAAFFPSSSVIRALNVWVWPGSNATQVRRFDFLMEWELGNLFYYRAGGRADVGDASPCGMPIPPHPVCTLEPPPPTNEPVVTIEEPVAGAVVRVGEELPLRVRVTDHGTVTKVKLKWLTDAGVVASGRLQTVQQTAATTWVATGTFTVPPEAVTGENRIRAVAINDLGLRKKSGPVRLVVAR